VSATAAVAVLSAGGAAALLARPAGAVGSRSSAASTAGAPALRMSLPLLALGAAALLLVSWLDGTALVLGLELLAGGAAVLDGFRRGRAARAAERRRACVVETAEALAGELRAGQPVLRALARTVEVWPPLAVVEAAARLGADVPGALQQLARQPGAEELARVASAWRVSHESGAGLALALGQVAASARARQASRHVVVAELASAQATARMVALLPVAVLAMGSGLGGRPWHFLLATPPGLACLAAGGLAAWGGLRWIDRIAARVLAP